MKTLIVLTSSREYRIKCHRFHAVTHETHSALTVFAQDQDGATLAAIPYVEQVAFEDVISSNQARVQAPK